MSIYPDLFPMFLWFWIFLFTHSTLTIFVVKFLMITFKREQTKNEPFFNTLHYRAEEKANEFEHHAPAVSSKMFLRYTYRWTCNLLFCVDVYNLFHSTHFLGGLFSLRVQNFRHLMRALNTNNVCGTKPLSNFPIFSGFSELYNITVVIIGTRSAETGSEYCCAFGMVAADINQRVLPLIV